MVRFIYNTLYDICKKKSQKILFPAELFAVRRGVIHKGQVLVEAVMMMMQHFCSTIDYSGNVSSFPREYHFWYLDETHVIILVYNSWTKKR